MGQNLAISLKSDTLLVSFSHWLAALSERERIGLLDSVSLQSSVYWQLFFGTNGRMTYNPSLHEEPRSQRARVLPQRQSSSILGWLEASGRLLARESTDFDYGDNEEEINALMAGDDNTNDFDDDDDEELELED
ncbi:DUF3134 domain-containing protein [Leptolyngbya sp. Cla-17]|uniref:DUF3134 domain-containing protein n=1 Tax=Leptolyngbya sp. Cla-17 TaxID=2803751 RepID=UPI0018D80CAF|nr:DUF3134 domain-containing protein [Leptolyngbya sp. Cla-17]